MPRTRWGQSDERLRCRVRSEGRGGQIERGERPKAGVAEERGHVVPGERDAVRPEEEPVEVEGPDLLVARRGSSLLQGWPSEETHAVLEARMRNVQETITTGGERGGNCVLPELAIAQSPVADFDGEDLVAILPLAIQQDHAAVGGGHREYPASTTSSMVSS